MSKDITIKQDGVAQNISVDKLRTASEEGGSADWVPEEDIGVKTLRVWRNGTYTAEGMGVYGFDVVEVAVDEHGGNGAETVGDAHTGELTAHNPVVQEGELARVMGGTKRLLVDKQGGSTLALVAEGDLETGSLSASSNRVYRARNDGKYAYTSVTVNVESGGGGGGGGGDEPYDPDNLPNALIVNPLNITYGDGDTIILQSGDAKAYVATPNPYGGTDYVIWTHPNYPNGIIPVGEVSISPTIADFDPGTATPGGYSTEYSVPLVDEAFTQPIITVSRIVTEWSEKDGLGRTAILQATYQIDGLFVVGIDQNGLVQFFHAYSTNPNAVIQRTRTKIGGDSPYNYDDSSTSGLYGPFTSLGGKTFYYQVVITYNNNNESASFAGIANTLKQLPEISKDAFKIQMATVLFDGTYTPALSFQTIHATWDRPHDGQALTSDFTLHVYDGQNPYAGGEVVGEGGTQT